MKSTVRPWFKTALLAMMCCAPAVSAAPDDGINDVRGVDVTQGDTATVVRISGDDRPTFSVYRLQRPLRLFVDISNSRLEDRLDTISVGNGVVADVSAVEYADELTEVTRVIIGFEQDAPYDVVADGDDLVITIDGAPVQPAVASNTPIEVLYELQASRDRVGALESALTDAQAQAQSAQTEILQAQLQREHAEQARLEAVAAQQAMSARLDSMSNEHQQPRAQISSLADEFRSRNAENERINQQVAAQEPTNEELASERRDAQSRLEQLRVEWANAEQASGSQVGHVSDVRFEQVDGVDRIVIEMTPGATFVSEPWEDGRASVVLSNAVLPDELRRTLDTQAFAGPVSFVSSYTETDGSVRVVADISSAASEVLRAEAGQLVWEFTGASAPPAAVSAAYTASPEPADVYAGAYNAQDGSYAFQGYRNQSSPFQQRPRLSNKRITIDLRNADIQNVLRLLADEGNINIVAADDVTGSVTLRLRSVPLDEALAIILQSKGYGWVQEGSMLRVAPLETFEAEYQSYIDRLVAGRDLEPLQVRLLPINYGTAAQMVQTINSVLSSRGTAIADQLSNSLVVTDVAGNLDAVEQVVRQLDIQTPQILIEARIVETNDQFRRQLGIQWGGDFVADQSRGNPTGLLFPSTVGIAGGATDAQAPIAGTSANPNFAVNLPAAAGTGAGGAIGLTLGSLSGAFNLNVRLSAAESQGSAKIISAPRIMTLHNQAASITSGVSIPVSVVSAAGNQTVFFDAALTLNVTPRVTPDGNIFLNVNVSKNEPDFENTGARGDPSIVRREAQTQLLVRDGDTTVIGGIFQRNTGFSTDQVPFFGSLPIIGPLFRSTSRTDVRNELLVFITPRIVNRDMSIDMMGAGDDVTRPDENTN